jgi:hypothetical protein
MMHLGKCPDLATIQAPNIVNSGSFTGTWSATSTTEGTFTVALAAAPDCSGGGATSGSSVATLKMNGCGKLRVTIGGTGCKSFATPSAFVTQRKALPALGAAVEKLRANGPGGGSPPNLCTQSGAMVPQSPHTTLAAEFRVRCGDRIALNVATLLHSECGARNVTLKIEVIDP